MTRRNRSRIVRGIGLALALLTAGCVGSETAVGGGGMVGSAGALQDGMINIVEPDSDPVDGGSVTFGAYSEPITLDPALTVPAVTTGGVEMLNIYDSLLRFDSAEGAAVPQLAESLSSNDDHTEWTLTLRDGVRFSDGTVLDAEAVRWSQERFAASGGPDSGLWSTNVEEIETPDESTVVYRLSRSWPRFSHMLAAGAGMIVARSADDGEEFVPVGAGPFTFEAWEVNNAMTLLAHPDYWDGAPHLERIEIAYIPTVKTAVESMFNGEIDVTYVSYPADVQAMLDQGFPGYVNMTASAAVMLINAADGRAGSDPRLREAMRLAIDSEAVVERAYGTSDVATRELFPEYSRWHSGVPGPENDLDRARELVAQAEADGFAGDLVLIHASGQEKQNEGLALQAQLKRIGIDLDVQMSASGSDNQRRVAAGDYDLVVWGNPLREPDPFVKMAAIMHSTGKQTYGAATGPEMDALIDELQGTLGPDEGVEVMADIQRRFNVDNPFVVYAYFPELVAWQESLHDVVGAANSMVMFHKAWKD